MKYRMDEKMVVSAMATGRCTSAAASAYAA
jgi:hypothetical protein